MFLHKNASLFLALVFALFASVSSGVVEKSLGPVPSPATQRLAAIRVQVALDEADWTYELGQRAQFTVQVLADETPLDGVNISYVVGPEFFENDEAEAVVGKEGLVIDGGTLEVPGFIRCTVKVDYNGKTYTSSATAGFEPETIRPTQVEPDDFDAFWGEQLEALAEVPLDAELTLLPERCTSTANVYHVSFQTAGHRDSRIYGIYSEPKAPGKYPAILMVPGAGVRAYGGDTYFAGKGAIVLQIGIHGIPVNLPDEVYYQLRTGALSGYWNYRIDSREHFYYRRVYLGCVRSNDFLTSRENWNGEELLVMGGSQGGQLTIVTSALDERVTALAANYPAFCDVTGPLSGRAGGWPKMFQPNKEGVTNVVPTEDVLNTTSYYDVVNFARRLTVPGFYGWGYNDVTCPPTSLYAAYNVITAPKELALLLQMGHRGLPELYTAVRDWVSATLELE